MAVTTDESSAITTSDELPAQMSSDDSSAQAFSNKRVSVRLDDTNFLQWKQQVILMMRGHGLESYLDKTAPTPARLISNADGSRVANPAYLRFVKQDSSLASWLLSTISPSILPQLVGMDLRICSRGWVWI
ncbi:hypothetical protein GQ457_09G001790 [Hibiscus cannabinus]